MDPRQEKGWITLCMKQMRIYVTDQQGLVKFKTSVVDPDLY